MKFKIGDEVYIHSHEEQKKEDKWYDINTVLLPKIGSIVKITHIEHMSRKRVMYRFDHYGKGIIGNKDITLVTKLHKALQ